MFAHAQAEGVELRLDTTEIQACRPTAGHGGRRALVSGKKQNTMKATVVADHQGRMRDATAARNAGIALCLQPARRTHRQDRPPDTYRAIAGPVSDHTAII